MRKDDDMRILISNDDGIFAPGLMALVRAFSAAGHTVYVAAPDSQPQHDAVPSADGEGARG